MKSFNLLALLLSLCMFLGFNSCSDDDDGPTKNVKTDYFNIEGGTFKDSSVPAGTANLPVNYNVNGTVVNGGSLIISLSSSEALKTLNIGVKNIDGYFEVPLQAIPKSIKADDNNYNYQVILLINQDISAKNFNLLLSVTNNDGNISPILESDRIEVAEAGTGKLQVTLAWDQHDDLDLHVIDPDGNHIAFFFPAFIDGINSEEELWFYFDCHIVSQYTNHDVSNLQYGNEEDHELLYEYYSEIEEMDIDEEAEFEKFIQSNYKDKIIAYLDIDSNAGCDIDGINNENIYFNKVKNGEYTIIVDLYSKCDSSKPGANYNVTLNYMGESKTFSNKQSGKFADDNPGNYDKEDGYVVIGKFTVTGAGNTYSVNKDSSVKSKYITKSNRKLNKKLTR